VLVSCDSLQNLPGPDEYCNVGSKIFLRVMGFFHPANLGPMWRLQTKPQAADFERLQRVEFDHVLCGHGDPVIGKAKERYAPVIREHFGVG